MFRNFFLISTFLEYFLDNFQTNAQRPYFFISSNANNYGYKEVNTLLVW